MGSKEHGVSTFLPLLHGTKDNLKSEYNTNLSTVKNAPSMNLEESKFKKKLTKITMAV